MRSTESPGGAPTSPDPGSDRQPGPHDPDLPRINDAWRDLPTAIRAGVIALVRVNEAIGRRPPRPPIKPTGRHGATVPEAWALSPF